MYLIDTNVISELARPKPNSNVCQWIAKQEKLTFSVITLHELKYGIERTKKSDKKYLEKWFLEFLSYEPLFLPVDSSIANFSGNIRARSETSGLQLTMPDSLIAATAIIHNLILVTRNIKDFEKCGVSLFNPFELIE